VKDNLKILVRAILAGVMISIGGTIYLACESKLLGAFLFSIGLYAICAFGLNLYTGKIGYVVDNKPKYIIELLITLLGNLIGTVACGYLLFLTRIGDKLRATAGVISDVKLNDNLLSIFILAIFCGIIMYLAVDLFKRLGDFGKYMGIFMGITVFILAGFEHCVANMYYFSAANMWTWKTILYVLVMIAGNSVGSILLALGMKFGLKK
jgi:formate/nitrite transporter FocA (FNT family)